MEGCHKQVLGVWVSPKLQTLVYDILPLEEGAGKRCWRKVPESDARSVGIVSHSVGGAVFPPLSQSGSVAPNRELASGGAETLDYTLLTSLSGTLKERCSKSVL